MHINEIKNKKVHWFEHARTSIPSGVEAIQKMVETRNRMNEVMAMRAMPNDTHEKYKAQQKVKLKFRNFAYTTFIGSRSNDSIAEPVTIIIIDIDKKDNPGLGVDDIFTKLIPIDYIACISTSIRGEGVYAIIPIQPKTDLEEFKHVFFSLQYEIAKIGLTIDPDCSDFQRIRFVGYCDRVYWKENDVEVYIPLKDIPTLKKKAPKKEYTGGETKTIDFALEDHRSLSELIKEIEGKKIDITGSYEVGDIKISAHKNWTAICFAIVNTYGEEGRNLFHRLSQFYPDYDYNEADEKYTHQLATSKGEHTLQTVYGAIRRAGVEVLLPEKKSSVTWVKSDDSVKEKAKVSWFKVSPPVENKKAADIVSFDVQPLILTYPSYWDKPCERSPENDYWRLANRLCDLEAAFIKKDQEKVNSILDGIRETEFDHEMDIDDLIDKYAPNISEHLDKLLQQ